MLEEPIQPYTVRSGARPAPERVHEVPPHLDSHLRNWLRKFLTPELAGRIALRMRLELTPGAELGTSNSSAQRHRDGLVDTLTWPGELPDAVDLALGLDPLLTDLLQHEGTDMEGFARRAAWQRVDAVAKLDQLLDDAGSTLTTASLDGRVRLVARVDPTAQASADRAISSADETAARLLARAWAKAYGRQTDADGAYHDAVRAVEALAGPLVLRASTRRTLNQVAQHLRDDGQRPEPSRRKWELVLTKLGDGTVEPLAAMFDRLWHGNLASRHGDDDMTYREVDLDEARAGVQLAVVCVQWLSDGVLRQRDVTGASASTP